MTHQPTPLQITALRLAYVELSESRRYCDGSAHLDGRVVGMRQALEILGVAVPTQEEGWALLQAKSQAV